jgi:CheY-like chemotaxis protein
MSDDGLEGRRLLVVEDEYFLAEDLARRIERAGARVVGPVGTVDDALDLIEGTQRLDGALLDINLRGEMAYPVADALHERGIPFVFTTGYDGTTIPPRYKGVARHEKPVDMARIARALFG